MAKVTLSLDGDIKEQAQQVLSDLGLSLSSAVELFLRTVVREDGIPFQVTRRLQKETGEHMIVRVTRIEGDDGVYTDCC